MFKRFNSETQCALFAGSVFIFFFVSSVFSMANANPLQWDDDPVGDDRAWTQPYNPDATLGPDELAPVPAERGGPDAAGPSSLGVPAGLGVVGPDPPSSWAALWHPISNFFQSLISYLNTLV